jgi:hypothetical protein
MFHYAPRSKAQLIALAAQHKRKSPPHHFQRPRLNVLDLAQSAPLIFYTHHAHGAFYLGTF